MTTFVPTRLPKLLYGGGDVAEVGGCIMQAVSVLVGERWTDQVSCVHPVLRDAAITANDSIDDESERSKLAPQALRLVGTANVKVQAKPLLVQLMIRSSAMYEPTEETGAQVKALFQAFVALLESSGVPSQGRLEEFRLRATRLGLGGDVEPHHDAIPRHFVRTAAEALRIDDFRDASVIGLGLGYHRRPSSQEEIVANFARFIDWFYEITDAEATLIPDVDTRWSELCDLFGDVEA